MSLYYGLGYVSDKKGPVLWQIGQVFKCCQPTRVLVLWHGLCVSQKGSFYYGMGYVSAKMGPCIMKNRSCDPKRAQVVLRQKGHYYVEFLIAWYWYVKTVWKWHYQYDTSYASIVKMFCYPNFNSSILLLFFIYNVLPLYLPQHLCLWLPYHLVFCDRILTYWGTVLDVSSAMTVGMDHLIWVLLLLQYSLWQLKNNKDKISFT